MHYDYAPCRFTIETAQSFLSFTVNIHMRQAFEFPPIPAGPPFSSHFACLGIS